MRLSIFLFLAFALLISESQLLFAQWTQAEVDGLTFKDISPQVVRLDWRAIAPGTCGATITYSVFRGRNDDFAASEDNRIASGITEAHYTAHEPEADQEFYYRVIADRVLGLCPPGFATLSHSRTASDRPSLSIGNVEVSLGMSRTHVYELFKSAHYIPQAVHLNKEPNAEDWLVCESVDTTSTICDTDGSVSFLSGILIQASVRWGPHAATASSIADAFIGAAHALSDKSQANCEIGARNQDLPNFGIRQAEIKCGGHHLIALVVVQHDDGSTTVEVNETISEKVWSVK